MTQEAICEELDVPEPPPGLDLEQAEFVRANVGYMAVLPMSVLLGVRPGTLKKCIDSMKLGSIKTESLPEAFEVPFLPVGTVRQKTSRGMITRIPTSTPGIVSRTIYTQSWGDSCDDET